MDWIHSPGERHPTSHDATTDAGPGSSTVEFQRALEAYETLNDPERRRLYDRDLRASRVRPTIVAQPMVSRPGVEPLFASRAVSLGFPNMRVTITRLSLVDELFGELLGSMADDWSRYRQ